MVKKTSEFGAGLTYCIGLFLAHADKASEYKKNKVFGENWPEMWFNGASDHCYELDTSTMRKGKLRKEIGEWQEKVIQWGHGFQRPSATEKDVNWAIDQAKEFLRLIDEKLLKVKTIKGEWR